MLQGGRCCVVTRIVVPSSSFFSHLDLALMTAAHTIPAKQIKWVMLAAFVPSRNAPSGCEPVLVAPCGRRCCARPAYGRFSTVPLLLSLAAASKASRCPRRVSPPKAKGLLSWLRLGGDSQDTPARSARLQPLFLGLWLGVCKQRLPEEDLRFTATIRTDAQLVLFQRRGCQNCRAVEE